MQILIGVIVGAAVGVGIHFLVPLRDTRGVVVGPMVGAVAAGVVWTALTWAGVGIDSVWLWLSSPVVAAVVTYPVLLVLSRSRVAHDAREKTRLRIG
ncbi:phosphate/sulfate permease [Microbacterium terrae]|uniref:GlsB/YeaQ/YmgE family stress response membrane protein n=1 Tax=Microbacterium terrae TaxID=69369 RepID=A0A0M2HG79_9MICO|nr:hypothetical protein [Microbacterium terrae]KJL43724.1 hypothetical protein RS81_00766 [Microbacterium terrae]KJL43741.1 hypothetical protein RS81_00783 [Microbacterium terrae]MBP1076988.1 phosphate/sulfate permease [Microbacterium terrae]GLJ99582.1 hypothetical protein GCM10017594_27800 [Microbacterium terrae]